MNDTYLSTPNDKRVPPGVESGDGIAASGQTLTQATAGNNTTVTVVAGAQYLVTAMSAGAFFFGIATVATAANIIWAVGANHTCVINIPEGITTLNYSNDTNGAVAYLRRIK
jgi:hypothetical protein